MKLTQPRSGSRVTLCRKAGNLNERHQPHIDLCNLACGWDMGCVRWAPSNLGFTGGIHIVLGSSFWRYLALEENTQQEVRLGHHTACQIFQTGLYYYVAVIDRGWDLSANISHNERTGRSQ